MRTLEDDEKQITINNFIIRQFFFITQVGLNASKNYSQNICEKCFDSTREFGLFKKQLIDNQEKLKYSEKISVDEEVAAEKSEIKSEQFTGEIDTESLTNDPIDSEIPDEDAVEEHLEPMVVEDECKETVLGSESFGVKLKTRTATKLCPGQQ